MITIRFEIYLQEPLLATAVEGDPNSAVSLPYIPGSLIRGALIGRYLQSNPTADLAADPQARQLFFDGATRYLNAYPAAHGGERTLPTPASWYKEKYTGVGYTAYDLSVEKSDEEKLKHPVRLQEPFCSFDDGTATLYSPRKQITVHTQRDRVMGRATEGSGAVFQYESLAPGQTFIALALCPDEQTTKRVEQLLKEGDMLLGGSRSAGYGLTEVRRTRRTGGEWSEAPNQELEDIQAGDAFSLILLSDAVLREAHGQHTGFLTPEILQTYLGAPLTLLDEYTYARSGVVGGFNRKWGLPLPQTPVARAGSVYTFRAEADIPANALRRLLDEGIGERRAEGLGRVALHWNRAESVEVKEPSKRDHPLSVTLADSGASATLARRMATRMLRRQLDAQLTEQVNKLKIKGEIKNNQLSNIRTLVRSAWLNNDAGDILKYLKEMKDTARKQFENARVDEGRPLDKWIQGLLQSPPKGVWATLYRTNFSKSKLPAVGGIRAEWDEQLAREYALRLIDGVLSRKLEERRAEK